MKKGGKTTGPFRYDINQILYNYTGEVTKRFKGLDLIECLKNYGWRFMTLYKRQGSRPYLRKRKAKRQNYSEHTGHRKQPLPTTQKKTLHMGITRWSNPISD